MLPIRQDRAPHLLPKSLVQPRDIRLAMESPVDFVEQPVVPKTKRPAKGDGSGVAVQAPLPHWYKFTIIAQDPSVKRPKPDDKLHQILTAEVDVPADWLLPGPRSHRFHVVDWDETRGYFAEPYKMAEGWTPVDRFKDASDSVLLEDKEGEQFRAQNVFAIAARTLDIFETALGRRVNWSFGDHQLFLIPSAGAMSNAYYSPEDHAIVFGYFKHEGKMIQTCLFHDVIAHETTHALLDALRPRLIEPGLADQRAFHEGFADIVALLSVFSVPGVVETALRSVKKFDAASLQESILLRLAEQWSPNNRPGGLRSYGRFLELKGQDNWRKKRLVPHSRGEVIVWAVMQTLIDIWHARVTRLSEERLLDMSPTDSTIRLAAEEGAKSAKHLLNMVIRALDYTPPGEIEFEDFLDAIYVSDAAVAPDDGLGYRTKLTESFEKFGIKRPQEWAVDMSGLRYENLHFNFLRDDRDEVYRFLWQNAILPEHENLIEDRPPKTTDGRPIRKGLGISREFTTRVESVWPSTRVGPDGFIVYETAVSYIQYLDASLEELAQRSQTRTPQSKGKLSLPRGVDAQTIVRVYGAGAIIFDQYGRVKYHQAKRLEDWDRQSRRLDDMKQLGIFSRNGGIDEAALRASLHEPRTEEGEW